jgi:hypothetical protein
MTEENKPQTAPEEETAEKRLQKLNGLRKQFIENLRAVEMQMIGACNVCGWKAEQANSIIGEKNFFKEQK